MVAVRHFNTNIQLLNLMCRGLLMMWTREEYSGYIADEMQKGITFAPKLWRITMGKKKKNKLK